MDFVADAIRVFVHDVDRALSFYSDLLELPLIGGSPELGYLVFETKGLDLIVEHADPADAEMQGLIGRTVGLSFRVQDIHRTCHELQTRGVHFTSQPEKQPWGGTLAHFADPEHNVFTLVQHP